MARKAATNPTPPLLPELIEDMPRLRPLPASVQALFLPDLVALAGNVPAGELLARVG